MPSLSWFLDNEVTRDVDPESDKLRAMRKYLEKKLEWPCFLMALYSFLRSSLYS